MSVNDERGSERVGSASRVPGVHQNSVPATMERVGECCVCASITVSVSLTSSARGFGLEEHKHLLFAGGQPEGERAAEGDHAHSVGLGRRRTNTGGGTHLYQGREQISDNIKGRLPLRQGGNQNIELNAAMRQLSLWSQTLQR